MFRSATFKLTLWYLAIVMAICLVFSVVLYQVTTGELSRGLHRETQRIYTQFPVFENNPLLKPGDDYDKSAHRIWLRLVTFNVVVLIGAGFASYWLAKRTLTPIEEAHEQQKRFTADVSHELRTPLTALKMESEVALLNKKASAKELRSVLASNVEEAGKLDALINSLLRLTRLEADELKESFSKVSIEDVVGDALNQVAPQRKAQNISIKSNIGKESVRGDKDNLTQLLVILLDNAIKFSPEGSVVTVSSKQQSNKVDISVQDHGTGIEREALEHIFDRFYRSEVSRSKETADGFGLGLSIAKMIVDLHDGVITVTSQLQKGTTVSVSLPLEPA